MVVFRALQVAVTPAFARSLWLEHHILLNLCLFFSVLVVYNGVVLPLCAGSQAFSAPNFIICLLGVLFPQYCWYRQRRIRKRVDDMIRQDIVVWEDLYTELMSRSESQHQLQRIIALSKPFARKVMRQMTRVDDELSNELKVEDSPSRSWVTVTCNNNMQCFKDAYRWVCTSLRSPVSRMGGEGVVREMHNGRLCEAIRSVDQLYLQAKTMVPYLSRLAQIWAHECQGMFRVERSNRPADVNQAKENSAVRRHTLPPVAEVEGEGRTFDFEKWRELQEAINSGTFEGKIAFAKLKLIPRILEKTQRCYRGDASQLTDLCRSAIAFESLEDLANCLELMLNDRRIEVDRIKNRLHPDYNVMTTQGYRDVNVNFRVVKSPVECHSDANWIKLGLSEHVCEVQLVPIEYFRIKSDEGHKKYIQYRNLKSE